MSPGQLVLIIGPSGVGKSVILRALKERHPEYVFPRSATTRPRREGEGNQLYHFVTDETFSAWEEQGKFLETAVVHGGARYGTLRQEIIPPVESGKTVIREVDVQGFLSIREDRAFSGPHPRHRLFTIFILPDSKEQLIAHIQKRAPMVKDELRRRLKSMEKELALAEETDVQVRNVEGKLEETIAEVERAMKN